MLSSRDIKQICAKIGTFILSDNSIEYVQERLLLDIEIGETDKLEEHYGMLKGLVSEYNELETYIDWFAAELDPVQTRMINHWDKRFDEICKEIINHE